MHLFSTHERLGLTKKKEYKLNANIHGCNKENEMDNEELLEKAWSVDITDDKIDMDLLCADIRMIKDKDMDIAMEYILFIISFYTELLSIDTSQIQEKGKEFVRSIFQIAGPQNELKKFLDTNYLPLTYIYPCIPILDGEDISELKKRFPKLMKLN